MLNGPVPEDGVDSGIPGIYLNRNAYGEERPEALMAVLKAVADWYQEEYGEEVSDRESILISGNMRYVRGELFVWFQTVSSYSWAGWIGRGPEGELLAFETEEELEAL